MLQEAPFWIVLAYLAGAIPVGVVIGRLRGVDIRTVGSGNIGATNATRALGRTWGLVVFAGDVLKAWTPVVIAGRAEFLGGHPRAQLVLVLAGAAAFLGHLFPVYLGFRGGKGVAVAFGVTLALEPAVAGLGAAIYLVTLIATRVSAIGSLTAAATMAAFVLVRPSSLELELLVLGFAILIFWRHRDNLRQIRATARAGKANGIRESGSPPQG